MTQLRTALDWLLVVLRAAPTYLTAIALIAGILLEELATLGPLPDWLTAALVGLIAVVGVAAAIVRRVTPVLVDARGVRPPAGVTAYTDAEARLETTIAHDLGHAVQARRPPR